MDSLATVFLSEVIGTAMLILLGGGVVANVVLAKNKGFGGGFLMITAAARYFVREDEITGYAATARA